MDKKIDDLLSVLKTHKYLFNDFDFSSLSHLSYDEIREIKESFLETGFLNFFNGLQSLSIEKKHEVLKNSSLHYPIFLDMNFLSDETKSEIDKDLAFTMPKSSFSLDYYLNNDKEMMSKVYKILLQEGIIEEKICLCCSCNGLIPLSDYFDASLKEQLLEDFKKSSSTDSPQGLFKTINLESYCEDCGEVLDFYRNDFLYSLLEGDWFKHIFFKVKDPV